VENGASIVEAVIPLPVLEDMTVWVHMAFTIVIHLAVIGLKLLVAHVAVQGLLLFTNGIDPHLQPVIDVAERVISKY